MEFPSRAILLSILSAALLAVVASFVLQETTHSSKLYCVPPNSPYTITTLNASLPTAKCFRVQKGIFTEILTEFPEEKFEVIDGHVLPGIIESHGHILQYGEMLESVELQGAESIEEIVKRVKQFLARHREEGYGTREKWVRGVGWDQAYFGGVMPTAEDLSQDPELEDLYISLDRIDVHCTWTSLAVLSLLPSPLPSAPPGGVIITDPGLGVFCDNAMDVLLSPITPIPDTAQKTRWFKTAMRELNAVGIVGVGDAGIRAADVAILEGLAERGEAGVRVNVMLECGVRNTFCLEEVAGLGIVEGGMAMGKGVGVGGNMVMLGGVKLFADGALGSWGAALLEPYSDRPESSGTMLINETELTSVVHQWFDAGFQVNIHAIGDRANRAAVDAFESVLGADCIGCNDARRLRIEHAQIIHPDDQKRIARMGIIPSIQPTHATSDMAYALSRLGLERLLQSAYRMHSLFPPSSSPNSPSHYPGPVLGSDFPVEPPSPFHGIYAATTRLSPLTGTSPSGPGGWYPEEKLSMDQALRGFTVNAAYGWGREGEMGLGVGRWADWIVVDGDVLGMGEEVRGVGTKETWVGGRRAFKKGEDGGEVRTGGWTWSRFMGWVGRLRRLLGNGAQEL